MGIYMLDKVMKKKYRFEIIILSLIKTNMVDKFGSNSDSLSTDVVVR